MSPCLHGSTILESGANDSDVVSRLQGIDMLRICLFVCLFLFLFLFLRRAGSNSLLFALNSNQRREVSDKPGHPTTHPPTRCAQHNVSARGFMNRAQRDAFVNKWVALLT